MSADTLPVAVQRRVAEAARAADPGGDVTLNVACPECGEGTRAELDIASFLWTELDAWARTSCSTSICSPPAYGWSEPEILALSPLRRRYYLELCADV
ncbi:Phage baseplate protein OS=Streptomyces violarus OX=67380 GN=FHS41_004943 PE=4 SV=1 [Streptomyces violarus]